jgi:hypothetical protein
VAELLFGNFSKSYGAPAMNFTEVDANRGELNAAGRNAPTRSNVMEKGRIVAANPGGGVNADAVRRRLML